METLPLYIATDGLNQISDGSLYVEKDISGLLQTKQTGHFDIATVYNIYNLAERFCVQCYRRTTDDTSNAQLSDYFYIIDGKIDKNKQAELNEQSTTIWQHLIDYKRFMTWQPNNKKIDVYHPELLYFPIKQTSSYSIQVREYYANGGTLQHQLTAFDANAYQIVMLVASYWNIHSGTDQIITSFDIWIEDINSVPVSEVRTYLMDYTYQRNARWWLYKNTFGVYEVIRTTGQAEKENNIKKTFINKQLPLNHTSADRDREQINVAFDYNMSVDSGPLAKDWSFHFSEFLTSNDVYMLLGGKYLPVEIEDGRFLVSTDKENLFNKTFKVTANILDDQDIDLTSKLPIQGDFNLDFGPKFFV